MSECSHDWIDNGAGLLLCNKCWWYQTPPDKAPKVTHNRDPWEKLYSEKEELEAYKKRVQEKCPHDVQLTSYPGKCALCEVRFYQDHMPR